MGCMLWKQEKGCYLGGIVVEWPAATPTSDLHFFLNGRFPGVMAPALAFLEITFMVKT